MNKKIIGFFSTAESMGGTETYVQSLLQYVNVDAFKIIFFCNSSHKLAPWIRSHNPNIEIIYIDGDPVFAPALMPSAKAPKKSWKSQVWRKLTPVSIRLLAGWFKDIIRIRRILRPYNLDLIHANVSGCTPVVVAAKLAGVKKIVTTFHYVPLMPGHPRRWIDCIMESTTCWMASRLIAVSLYAEKAWKKQYPLFKNKVAAVHNGLDTEKNKIVPSMTREQFLEGLKISNPRMLMIVPARFMVVKGHKFLLHAFQEVLKTHPDVYLLLPGDGQEEENLRALSKDLDLTKNIRFLGYCHNLPEVMSFCDLVILPSLMELFPYALLEAMLCSKVVIASNVGGIPEIVKDGETGLLVSPGDSAAQKEAILYFLKNPQMLSVMGAAGKMAVQQYSMKNMIQQTSEIFSGELKSAEKVLNYYDN